MKKGWTFYQKWWNVNSLIFCLTWFTDISASSLKNVQITTNKCSSIIPFHFYNHLKLMDVVSWEPTQMLSILLTHLSNTLEACLHKLCKQLNPCIKLLGKLESRKWCCAVRVVRKLFVNINLRSYHRKQSMKKSFL